MPWLLAGDFNALLSDDEKKGGSKKSGNAYKLFQNFCNDHSLKILGFRVHVLLGIEGQCLRGLIEDSVIFFGNLWRLILLCFIFTGLSPTIDAGYSVWGQCSALLVGGYHMLAFLIW